MNRTSHIENFLILLIIILPISLITGPFLPDLIVTLSALYSLFLILLNKNLFINGNINNKKIVIFLLFFCLIITLISIFSEYGFLSLKTSLFYIRFILFLILFNYFLSKHEKNFLKYFFYSSTFGYFFFIFDAYIQYFFGYDLFLYEKPHQRLTATFGDEQIVGSFVSKFMPLYIGLLYLLDKKKFFIFFTLFISCVITLLSGERSATFYILIFSLIILILLSWDKKLNILYFILLITITYASFLITDRDLKKRHFSSIETILDSKDNKITIFSKAHEYHYLSAYKIFLDNKIIGTGPKTYRYECKKEKYYISKMSCTTHPHNVLLQFASETGIIGLIFYFTSLIYLFISFYKIFMNYIRTREKKDFFNLCLILCIFNYLSFLLPSGNFFNNWLSSNLFIPLSFFVYYYKLKK